MKTRCSIGTWLLFCLICFFPIRPAQANPLGHVWNKCRETLRAITPSRFQISRTLETRKAPETFEDLMAAFRSGYIPNFSDPDQELAFRIYRGSYWKYPSESGEDSKSLHHYLAPSRIPQRELLPDQNFRTGKARYPLLKDMPSYKQLNALLQKIHLMKEDMRQFIEMNPPFLLKEKRLSQSDFDALFTPQRQALLKSETSDNQTKIGLLFTWLAELREAKIARQEATKYIDQNLLDIAETYGFWKPDVVLALKDKSGASMDYLEAVKVAYSSRSDFVGNSSFQSYKSLLETLHLKKGSRMPEDREIKRLIKSLEDELDSHADKTQIQELTLRQLSAAEAPFRSCLGGDCSSRTYFDRAFDPAFHYFTLTDKGGNSAGHITLATGTVGRSRWMTRRRVAFIDKVQGIPDALLPAAFEALRRSLASNGIKLTVPTDLGDHNGISNLEFTRDAIARLPAVKNQTRPFGPFQVDRTSYASLARGYSRAFDGMQVKEVLPMDLAEIQFKKGALHRPWTVEKIDLDTIIANTFALKNGDTDDKIRYLLNMEAISQAHREVDPEYHALLEKWMGDAKTPLRLKSYILVQRILKNGIGPREESWLVNLSSVERSALVDNWIERPAVLQKLSGDTRGLLFLSLSPKGVAKAVEAFPFRGAETLKATQQLAFFLKEMPLEAVNALLEGALGENVATTGIAGDAKALALLVSGLQILKQTDLTRCNTLKENWGGTRISHMSVVKTGYNGQWADLNKAVSAVWIDPKKRKIFYTTQGAGPHSLRISESKLTPANDESLPAEIDLTNGLYLSLYAKVEEGMPLPPKNEGTFTTFEEQTGYRLKVGNGVEVIVTARNFIFFKNGIEMHRGPRPYPRLHRKQLEDPDFMQTHFSGAQTVLITPEDKGEFYVFSEDGGYYNIADNGIEYMPPPSSLFD